MNHTHLADAAAWQARLSASGLDLLREHAAARQLKLAARRFIFLRHGETDGNALKIYQPAEISLNDQGRVQARAAAELLRHHAVQRICASDMQRAWETAAIVGRTCRIDPMATPALRERWFGDLVGTSSAQLNWRVDPPNSEGLNEFVARTQAGLEAALSTNEDTLLVAHGGNLYVLAFSLGLELTPAMVQNATPLVFSRLEQGWRVMSAACGHGEVKDTTLLRNVGW